MPTEFVIIGGGLNGLCTALSILESPDRPPDSRVTLIECAAIGTGASGSAGGLIGGAGVWYRPATVDLARLSADLWKKLVDKFDGSQSFGFRNATIATLLVGTEEEVDDPPPYGSASDGANGVTNGHHEPWTNGELIEMGPSSEGGLILPQPFCSRVFQHCTQLGLRTIIATPTGRSDKVIHTSTGQDVSYDVLAITAGPWCNDVCQALNLPQVAITGGPRHFVQMQTGYIPGGLHELPPQVLFVGIGDTIQTASDHLAALDVTPSFTSLSEEQRRAGLANTLQVLPRADGRVYITGENHLHAKSGALPDRKHGLPLDPRDVPAQLDQLLISRLVRTAKTVSSALDVDNGAQVVRGDIAFRTSTPDSHPLVGKLADSVFICGGHGVFSVSLAPACGQVMSELLIASVLGRKPVLSADISGLDPLRFSQKQVEDFQLPVPATYDKDFEHLPLFH